MTKKTETKRRNRERKQGGDLMVRPEQKHEYGKIREIIQEAFDPMPFSTGREWELVERIRNSSGYIPALALVALWDQELVGHSMISLVPLRKKKKDQQILVLGPVSVKPDFQRRGIGAEMIRVGIGSARRLSLPAMVVVGDPAYYRRFGFEPAQTFQLKLPFGLDQQETYFQVLELVPGGLKSLEGGQVIFPSIFFDEKGDFL